MTIDEFFLSMRVALVTFIAHWKFMHEGTPEQWPLELNDGEWMEQWIAHLMELEDRKQAELEEQL